MDRTNELEEQVEKLTGDVEEMRARMARLEGEGSGHENGSAPKSRRNFLRFGAGAILGALGVAATKVLPAQALTGGNFILGNANAAGATTNLTGDTTVTAVTGPNPVLQVKAANHNGGLLTTALGSNTFQGPVQALGGDAGTGFDGLDAFASGASSAAVWGLTDHGYGVIGESNQGIGLYARRSGRIRQEGLALPNAPTYSPNLYEQVRDSNGVLWIHNAAGVWRRVNSLRFDTADGTGGFFAPFRLVDTRDNGGAPKGSNTVSTYPVPTSPRATGASAIPADAVGVVGNVTAVGYSAGGYLTVYPAGVVVNGSTVNFITGQYAIANAFTVGLGSGGAISVFVGSAAPSHFIIDINGYIQ